MGHLRIGFSDDFIYSNFSDVMAEFNREHVNVIVTYQLALSAELVSRLRDGLLDLVLACFPLAAPGAHVLVTELLRLPIVAVVSRAHRLADRQAVWLKELREDGFLLFPENIVSGFSAHIARLFAHARFTLRAVGYIHSTQIMAELAARRVGVGLLTRTSLPADYPGVSFLALRDRQASVDTGALYAVAGRNHSYELIERIVDALRGPKRATPGKKPGAVRNRKG